jgi:hypothetical protein
MRSANSQEVLPRLNKEGRAAPVVPIEGLDPRYSYNGVVKVEEQLSGNLGRNNFRDSGEAWIGVGLEKIDFTPN